MKKEQGAGQRGQQGEPEVAAPDVRHLVRQGQPQFLGRERLGQAGRQQDDGLGTSR